MHISLLPVTILACLLVGCGEPKPITRAGTQPPPMLECGTIFIKNDDVALRRCDDGSTFMLDWATGERLGPMTPSLFIEGSGYSASDWPATLWLSESNAATIRLPATNALPSIQYRISLDGALVNLDIRLSATRPTPYSSLGLITSTGPKHGLYLAADEAPRCWPAEPSPPTTCRGGIGRVRKQLFNANGSNLMVAVVQGDANLSIQGSANAESTATGFFVGYPSPGRISANIELNWSIGIVAGSRPMESEWKLSKLMDTDTMSEPWIAQRYLRQRPTVDGGLLPDRHHMSTAYLIMNHGPDLWDPGGHFDAAARFASVDPHRYWALYVNLLRPLDEPGRVPAQYRKTATCDGDPCQIPDVRSPFVRARLAEIIATIDPDLFGTVFFDLGGQYYTVTEAIQVAQEIESVSAFDLVYTNGQLPMHVARAAALGHRPQPDSLDEVGYWLAQIASLSPGRRHLVFEPETDASQDMLEALAFLAGGLLVTSTPTQTPISEARPLMEQPFALEHPMDSPPRFWQKGPYRVIFNWDKAEAAVSLYRADLRANTDYIDVLVPAEQMALTRADVLLLPARSAVILRPLDSNGEITD